MARTQKYVWCPSIFQDMSRQAIDTLVEYAGEDAKSADSYDALRKAIQDILDSE